MPYDAPASPLPNEPLPPLVLTGLPPELDRAPWWIGHDHDLASALAAAKSAAPHLDPLTNLLIPRLPRGVLASSTIKDARPGEAASSRVVRLSDALGHQWFSMNGRKWTNTETIDLDHTEWRERLQHARSEGVCDPAAVVLTPAKGTAHLIWIYAQPFDNEDPEHVRIRRGVRRGLDDLYGGDRHFANRLQKNPWHRAWGAEHTTYQTEIIDLRTVTGREMLMPLLERATRRRVWLLPRKVERSAPQAGTPAQQAPAKPVAIPGAQTSAKKGSRLWNSGRFAVYRACTADYAEALAIFERTARALRSPAARGDIEDMARRCSTWMADNWWGPLKSGGTGTAVGRRPIDAGVMTGEAADRGPAALADWKGMTVTERRQAAGQRSGQRRRVPNDDRIREAVLALAAEGKPVTKDAVAQRAEVSISTVKRRWSVLDLRSQDDVEGGLNRSNPFLRPQGATPAQPGPSNEKITPCSLAARLRDAAARDRQAVQEYDEAAQRMARRGGTPESIRRPADDASPLVMAAWRRAQAAHAEATRRAEDRRRRVETARRAEEREAWHREHANDEAAWAARLSEIRDRHGAAIERELRRGGDADRLERIDHAFASVFGAEHRARRRAQGGTLDPPRPRKRGIPAEPDLIDLAIPW